MNENFKLRFYGGAGTVTGSTILLETDGSRILIDCGMFQGLKALRLLNREQFPADLASVDAVILTHGHLDHCGRLPVLVRRGFAGPVYCTEPTRDVAGIILLDSARIQEEDAERANRLKYTRHHPARPLYTREDVAALQEHFAPVEPGVWHPIGGDIRFRLRGSGHILGSTFVEVVGPFGTIVFSGDQGRPHPLLLHPPEPLGEVDILVVESTYGDRNHPATDPREELATLVRESRERGGHLIIPSFAVERAQEIMFLLSTLRKANEIPPTDIFLDSPMGASITDLMARYESWHTLGRDEFQRIFRDVTLVREFSETRRLLERTEPAVFIAGSGMIAGGRVLHYLERFIGDPATTVLLVGFQAEGTRGRALLEGAQEIKFFGSYHPVRARVRMLANLSAHADRDELLAWVGTARTQPRKVYINHGERVASLDFARAITKTLGWRCVIPEME